MLNLESEEHAEERDFYFCLISGIIEALIFRIGGEVRSFTLILFVDFRLLSCRDIPYS